MWSKTLYGQIDIPSADPVKLCDWHDDHNLCIMDGGESRTHPFNSHLQCTIE